MAEFPRGVPPPPPQPKIQLYRSHVKKGGKCVRTISQEDVSQIKHYLEHQCLPKTAPNSLGLADLKRRSEKFQLIGSELFYCKQGGKLLKVVAMDDSAEVDRIISEAHGAEHRNLEEMHKLIKAKYFGFLAWRINAWLKTCPICSGIIGRQEQSQRFQDLVKVVREPWFAVLLYTIELRKFFPERGGVIVVLQDIYSKFVFARLLSSRDGDATRRFMAETMDVFGVPEVLKVFDPTLLGEEVLELCEEKTIQVVEPSMNPDHFTSRTSTLPRSLTNYLASRLENDNLETMTEQLARSIHDRNFLAPVFQAGFRAASVHPASIFFRRPVRIDSKSKHTSLYCLQYEITRADLPSIIDLLPEDPELLPLPGEESGLNPVPDNSELPGSNRLKLGGDRQLEQPPQVLSDKELEQLVRPDKERLKQLLLYDPEAPTSICSEVPESEGYNTNGWAMTYFGKLVYLATPDSFIVPGEFVNYEAEIPKIPEIEQRVSKLIQSPTIRDFFGRSIVPDRFELEPDQYWVISHDPTTSACQVYNIQTKETKTVSQLAVFKADSSLSLKNKHLLMFLHQKFNGRSRGSGGAGTSADIPRTDTPPE